MTVVKAAPEREDKAPTCWSRAFLADHTSGAPSLFHQEWWLNAASGGCADDVSVRWDGVTVAWLPFARRSRFGLRIIGMPPYTRTLGPSFLLPESKAAARANNLRRLSRDLLQRLPSHDRFFHLLDPGAESAFAFSANGCLVQQQFTFRVKADDQRDAVWANIDGRTRRLIRSARMNLGIETHADLERFIAVSYRHYGKRENRHDFPAIRRIFQACCQRDQATILSVTDAAGGDVASVILVWGCGVLYYWLPALDRSLAPSGANALLLWEAMQLSARLGCIFDSDSFRSGGAAKFFTGFGLRPVVRPVIAHLNLLGHVAQALIDRRSCRTLVAPVLHERRGQRTPSGALNVRDDREDV